jgi:putative hemolysin
MLLPTPLAPFPLLDLLIIVLLVALNGLLSMSELAIVSARRPRLKAMEKAGRRGATAALALAADPGRFLSAVQIGITLIGILAGAYSGASLGVPVGQRLALLGIEPDLAARLGFILVIIGVTYLSLVIGELVPSNSPCARPNASRSSWRSRCNGWPGSPRPWCGSWTAPAR